MKQDHSGGEMKDDNVVTKPDLDPAHTQPSRLPFLEVQMTKVCSPTLSESMKLLWWWWGWGDRGSLP